MHDAIGRERIMSILIDNFVKENFSSAAPFAQVKYDNVWYLAKPVPYTGYKAFLRSLKDSFKVLTGKAFAVHYKKDEE